MLVSEVSQAPVEKKKENYLSQAPLSPVEKKKENFSSGAKKENLLIPTLMGKGFMRLLSPDQNGVLYLIEKVNHP